MNYRSCWITVNRACNLRCEWCYARDTNYNTSDDMPIKLAYEIVDICKNLNITDVVLIGGEPTIYPHFFDIIDYCHDKKIHCGVVTNGLIFKDNTFVEKMLGHGIKSVSVSLKGENKKAFLNTAKIDKFDDVIIGIKNCINAGIKVTISMVITEKNVDTFLEGIKLCKSIGVNRFHFSFCNSFNNSGNDTHYLQINNPRELIRKFVKHIKELKEITDNKFSFQNIYPLCIWDDKDYKDFFESSSAYTVCQLLKKSGLIFDNNGYLIPCNAMYSIKLGKLHDDFVDSESLLKFSNSELIKNAYQKLCGVPDLSCLKCNKLTKCGGGCVCQWTNYTFDQLINTKEI